MKKLFSLVILCFFLCSLFIGCTKDGAPEINNATGAYQVIVDNEDHQYDTVVIGNQVWTTENLRTGSYNNEDVIISVLNDSITSKTYTTGAVAASSLPNGISNGYLYNWYAATDSRGIAVHLANGNNSPATPLADEGWRIPTQADWNTLINFLGFDSAGYKLDTIFTNHSIASTVLFGGNVSSSVKYQVGKDGCFWSSNNFTNGEVDFYLLNYYNTQIDAMGISKSAGCSIRCVRDK